ncbi:MAG TPA: hypothetical protein VFE62_15035 [Gemmataceae bacterium]|nr:hypothetical protein [Gemmataceae bacterium]
MTMKTQEMVAKWMTIGGLALGLASCSVLAPGVYVLIMLPLICLGILAGTCVLCYAVCESSPIGWMFVGDILLGGLRLMLVVSVAMLGGNVSND